MKRQTETKMDKTGEEMDCEQRTWKKWAKFTVKSALELSLDRVFD